MAAIVIVGGGIAGLACARRLSRAGHDVEVLERTAAAGGDLHSSRCDGFVLERGESAFGPGDVQLRALVRELGLSSELQPVGAGGRAILRRGRFEVFPFAGALSALRSPLLSARAKLRSARLALALARRRAELDATRPERAAAFEHDDAATMLVREAGLEARDFLLGPLVCGELGAPLEQLSDAVARMALRRSLAVGERCTLAGGMGGLVSALVSSLPLALRFGCEVERVETCAGGARVDFRAGGRVRRVYADAVVVAVAGPRAARVCVGLRPGEHAYLAALRSLRALEVQLLLDDVPRVLASLDAWTLDLPAALGLDVARVRVEHARRFAAPPGAGLLRVALSADAAARGWRRDDARVVERTLATLERTPLGRLRPARALVVRRAHAAAAFGPGALQRLARFLSRPPDERAPRLAFAGDHVVGPYTEGALVSGLRAADAVLEMCAQAPAAARSGARERPGRRSRPQGARPAPPA